MFIEQFVNLAGFWLVNKWPPWIQPIIYQKLDQKLVKAFL
jgi:hypothetical protein